MNNVNVVDVQVKTARIRSMWFEFEEANELPKISVGIDLLTPKGNVISQFTLSTGSWNQNQKIEHVPAEVYMAFGHIVAEMLPVVTRKINGIDKAITQETAADI